ncbi:LysR substrate-binding domain-containing protein [Variovorax sp. 54]|uniref:LysR substrate-binding domain-containing protein n=1 Tax=Variovorax sp. 54 TaxID=2035212 RepID=UPI0027BA9344|nr:LysR substrate-binding domain-containing protein [Variovorax sp. 54]
MQANRGGSGPSAACSVGLSQPTPTQQVQALEHQHAVSSTGPSHRADERRRAASSHRAPDRIARSGLLQPTARQRGPAVKLGAVGPLHVLEMVDAYRKRYPRLDVSIRMGNSVSVFRGLEEYAVDIGVLASSCTGTILSRAGAKFAWRNCTGNRRFSARADRAPGARSTRRVRGRPVKGRHENRKPRGHPRSRRARLGIGAVSEAGAEFIPDHRLRAVRIQGAPAVTPTYLHCLQVRRESRVLAAFFHVALKRRRGAFDTAP